MEDDDGDAGNASPERNAEPAGTGAELSAEDRAQMFNEWCALMGLLTWPVGAYSQLLGHLRDAERAGRDARERDVKHWQDCATHNSMRADKAEQQLAQSDAVIAAWPRGEMFMARCGLLEAQVAALLRHRARETGDSARTMPIASTKNVSSPQKPKGSTPGESE